MGPGSGPQQGMQTQAEAVERQDGGAKRRKWPLALGTALLLLLGTGLGGWYYATWVLGYAELGPDSSDPKIPIARDALDPDRVTLSCQPLTPGKVGFSQWDADRGQELFEEVGGGVDERLEWRSQGTRAGDVVTVTYRRGWRLIRQMVALPERLPGPRQDKTKPGGEVVGPNPSPPKPTGEELVVRENLYSARTRGNREQWIVRYGGSPETELAVERGLAWLARHQAKDGHWGEDCLGTGEATCCLGPKHCTSAGGAFSVAQAGLATLAFQAGGQYGSNAKVHSEVVRHGLDWLVTQQGENGALYTRGLGENHHDHMYEHGIAAWALCDACAVATAAGKTAEPRCRAAAEKAVRFIESQQHRDGGWRYSPRPDEASDTSVSGWQVLALKSAKDAGIAVSSTCLEKAVRFFRSCRWLDTGKTRYYVFASEPTPAVSGAGLLVQEFVLEQPDAEWVRQGAEYLADFADSQWSSAELDSQTHLYAWHYCALAMFQHGGEFWKRWNDSVQERVRGAQDQDSQSCTLGSWDWQSDDFGKQGGRITTTALATLTLEVYYRYHSEQARVYGEAAQPVAPTSP